MPTKKSTTGPARTGSEPGSGDGTAERPWTLRTPSGSTEYQAWRDETANPPALVVQVGKTQLRYHLRCIEDLHAMLQARGDWTLLGSADEHKPATDDTVACFDVQLPHQRLDEHQSCVGRQAPFVRESELRHLV